MRIQDRETDVTMNLLLGGIAIVVVSFMGHALTSAGHRNATFVPNAQVAAAQSR